MINLLLLNPLLSLGALGVFSYCLGLFGLFRPLYLSPLLLLCFWSFLPLLKHLSHTWTTLSRLEKGLTLVLFAQFLLYSLGLFIPETGFDALWYHLPEAQVYAANGQIAKIPELLYSTMPRLGEIYFAIPLLFSQSLILVKSVSFLFAFLFILISYFLSRCILSRLHSLLVAVVVNSVYLISWQATSAYVDLPTAVFQLASLLCLIKQISPGVKEVHTPGVIWLVYSGLFAGLALSVKYQSFLHLFAATAILVIFPKKSRLVAIGYTLMALLIAFPWYLDNYLKTGHLLYPTNLPSLQQAALNHAGASSLPEWLLHQTLRLPLLFGDLTFHPRDYLSPIFLILLPILFFRIKNIIQNRLTLLAIGYTLVALSLWWFLPPPETRYLLGVLPLLLILEFWSVFNLPRHQNILKNWSLVFIFLSAGLNLFLRAGTSFKYLPVILGQITPSQYITTQTTDFNQDIVSKFYSGYWQKYQYPNSSPPYTP